MRAITEPDSVAWLGDAIVRDPDSTPRDCDIVWVPSVRVRRLRLLARDLGDERRTISGRLGVESPEDVRQDLAWYPFAAGHLKPSGEPSYRRLTANKLQAVQSNPVE
jgi:hypothetical protein